MSIVRILVIDPMPEPGRSDVLCYQVPENSRESQLLVELLDSRKLDHTQLSVSKPKKGKKMKLGSTTRICPIGES